MNETDEKILEKPEVDLWDRSSRNQASDLEDDLHRLTASTNKTGARMIEKDVVPTGSNAELLNLALEEVKTKAYEESEARLDYTQALDALVACFRNAERGEREKAEHLAHISRTVTS